MIKDSYYAIHKGHKTGIFKYLIDCKKYVRGYNNPIYQKCQTKEDALFFVKHGHERNIIQHSTKNKLEEIDIYTDGSSVKKNEISYGGFGIYIPKMGIRRSYILTGYKTNNRAELMAIITALSFFQLNSKFKLNIYTDSQYGIKIFTYLGIRYKNQNYKTKKGKDVTNRDIVKQAVALIGKYDIHFTHVPAHRALKEIKNDFHSIGNRVVDKLALGGSRSDEEITQCQSSNHMFDMKHIINKMKRNIKIQKLCDMYLYCKYDHAKILKSNYA